MLRVHVSIIPENKRMQPVDRTDESVECAFIFVLNAIINPTRMSTKLKRELQQRERYGLLHAFLRLKDSEGGIDGLPVVGVVAGSLCRGRPHNLNCGEGHGGG